MRLAVVGAFVVVALLGCSAPDEPRPSSSTSAQPTASSEAPLRSLADLPTGRPPKLAYVVAGSSVVFPDHSVDLEWEVDAIVGGFVFDASGGAIHRVGVDGITLVSSKATSAPVHGGTIAWIEKDAQIVLEQEPGQARQPLGEACCVGARLLGFDVDIDRDIYLAAPDGAWMWDTYEGREGLVDPPPDSEDYFWRVGGLGRGSLVDTGISSEILVDYPGGKWGWGYVAGPRDPSRDDPVLYEEQERTAADRVWLTTWEIVALEPAGRLVVLGSEDRDDRSSHHWRELTGERTAFELPDDLQVDGVVSESLQRRRTVLVDATDRTGQRAWVRCNLRTYACEVATELGPDDIVPM
jgi:hypothetical protein